MASRESPYCMSLEPCNASLVCRANLVTSYFTSVFVSLGVFLFGYDQGVMSGIITYGQETPHVLSNLG